MVIKYGAAPKRFESTWDTTQAGSANDTVVLPLVSDGSYNFRIDWGDGKSNRDDITVYNQSEVTHQYDDTGIYTIKVVGDITGWQFNNGGDDDKILDVSQWGPLIIDNFAFNGCSNLNVTAKDIFYLRSSTTNDLFRNCGSLLDIPGFHLFDTSHITSFRTMLYDSDNFASAADLNNWNTSNVTDMSYSFFDTEFSGKVSGWDTSNVTIMLQLFDGCNQFNDNIGNWNTSKVTNMSSMLAGCSVFDQDVGNWDVSGVTSMSAMFSNCTNFNNGGSSSISGWDTSSCTSMQSMFWNDSNFNQPIGNWDVSKVGSMRQMLRGTSFNQDIGNWDVSSVTSMELMFYYATVFNNGGSPSISGWDTSNVTTMRYMFRNTAFNQPIGNWDTSSVTNMSEMLNGSSSFNQDIGNWDVSKVTNMSSMLQSTSFDQDVGNWDVSGVTSMSAMFSNCTNFNNGGSSSISGWNTSSCTSMNSMFAFSDFNQPIGSWDVSKVTSLYQMFRSTPFNQDVSAWDTSSCTNMELVFYYATGFNQPIGNWNTSKLTNIRHMLTRTAIDQDLSNWVVTGINYAPDFMSQSALSTTNYDRTLSGWSSQAVQNGVGINFGSSKYSTATGLAYRNALVASGWTITDGGAA